MDGGAQRRRLLCRRSPSGAPCGRALLGACATAVKGCRRRACARPQCDYYEGAPASAGAAAGCGLTSASLGGPLRMLSVMQWCVLGLTFRRTSASSSRLGLFAGQSGDEAGRSGHCPGYHATSASRAHPILSSRICSGLI